MNPLVTPMHAIAAQRGDGLRPELASLPEHAKAYRALGASGMDSGAAYRSGPEFVPCARAEALDVETLGPMSLLPHGQKCSIHFVADRTATIILGTRNYGHGHASPYFASIAVTRLGIPLRRIRLYYAGVHPAVKISFCDLPNVPRLVATVSAQ